MAEPIQARRLLKELQPIAEPIQRAAPIPREALLRLWQVLQLVPISASTWWAGVNLGRFPQPIHLGRRTTVWRAAEVFDAIDCLVASGSGKANGATNGKPGTPK
jgi:predicted DNA-binding transcriptional regulator AlpA